MVEQMTWVPEPVYRRSVGMLRGWVIALAILVLIGLLILGGVVFRTVFATSPFPVVSSSPRDCRLSGDSQDPKLYVVVDAAMIVSASLAQASTLGPSGLKVEAIGIVPSLVPLSRLDDAEFERMVEAAGERSGRLDEDEPTGVIVAVVDTDGERSGYVRGLQTVWALGEPAVEQVIPLGVDFAPTGCTVTTAR